MHGPGHCKCKRRLSGTWRSNKEEFPYFMNPVPVEEFPVVDSKLYFCDDSGLFRSANKVLHLLLHLFWCEEDDEVKCTTEFFVLTYQFGYACIKIRFCIFKWRIFCTDCRIGDTRGIDILIEKGECRILFNNGFPALPEKPLRCRFKSGNTDTLSEFLISNKRIC